jgi:uncharacterized protein YcbX
MNRMRVAGLWRYPVKSLAGELLHEGRFTLDGVAGDRALHVRNARSFLTGRVRHGLLTIPATTGDDGSPLVAGFRWDSREAAGVIRTHGGADAELGAYSSPERFDVANLLVATDGTVDQFGHDIRRLRPNLLISGVTAGSEGSWPGRAIAIGDAVIGVHSLRGRCVVTSIDPDTGDRTPEVLRRIRRDFAGQLGLNAWVIREGTVCLDDPVTLVDTAARPSHLGGWVVGAPYDL